MIPDRFQCSFQLVKFELQSLPVLLTSLLYSLIVSVISLRYRTRAGGMISDLLTVSFHEHEMINCAKADTCFLFNCIHQFFKQFIYTGIIEL